MKKRTTLTLKNLTELFAVSAPTIYAWQVKLAMPRLADATPAAIKRWSLTTGIEMTCEPSSLLGKGILKRGPKAHLDAGQREVVVMSSRRTGKTASLKLILATTNRPSRSATTKSVAKRKAVR